MASNEQRGEAWDNAIHAFGTSYIFERRLKAARKKLRWLTFLGIAVPVMVGGVVVTFFAVQEAKVFLRH